MRLKKIFRRLFPQKDGMQFPGGYIPTRYILKGIEDLPQRKRALVIGDQFGRDYWLLKSYFDEVKAIDVVDNEVIEPKDLILQDASKPTDLEAGSFDYVVACNVIEHMFGEYDCICEVNRLLVPGGRFFIDVPFLADRPYFHFRVYTPKIFLRMMQQAGYEELDSRFRGFSFFIGNNSVALFSLLLYPFFGKQALLWVNKTVYALHRALDRSYWINRINSDHFGGYLLYKRITDPVPEVDVQVKHFGVVSPAT